MSITFPVSSVARANSPLLRYEHERGHNRQPFEAMGTRGSGFIPTERNGLFAAAHVAYANHYPIVLSPDAVWLVIAQGFARHVNVNAERLRSKFVQHKGSVEITVRRDDFVKGSKENPWPEVFGEFSDAIAEHIGKQRNLLVCDFSTTGRNERAASEIVLLDAMKSYCSYFMMTMCGIPEITLEGTLDDWRSIRQRAQALEEYELSWWTDALLPILDQFVAAADGYVDTAFWKAFFKEDGASGGPWVGGWINAFFPYIMAKVHFGGSPSELTRNDRMQAWRNGGKQRHGEDIKMIQIPSGVSCVPFQWQVFAETFPMEFLGGFLGITQDADTLAVRPAIGWAVRDALDGEGDA